MMTSAYGPFIHTGGWNSPRQDRAWRQPHPQTYGLWASLDGSLTYDDGSGAAPLRLPGPAALFITPGADRVVTAAASQWFFLRFDVVDLPRRRLPHGRAWCPTGPVTQPSPQAIWGFEPPTVVPEFLRAGAIQALRDCCALWWRSDHFHAQANATLGHWLMDYVISHLPCPHPGERGSGLHQRCRDLIHERLGLGIGVTDLAAACGYSRVHFVRRFKALTGKCPGHFIRQERMALACHLLAATDLGLLEVAERCGYRSVAAFSRGFAKLRGSAPGVWRRRYR